uniref:Uncharacterized protein n=1 Tax=Noccaea caerulescens TaxID=107243 RepID=A0A1J3INC5_NOCCA
MTKGDEEQIRFQRLSKDLLKSRMADKSQTTKHVSPESLILSILNDLFLNSRKFDQCLRKSANTNQDSSSLISSLNFAKVGNFTLKSNDKSVTIGSRAGLDVGHLLKSALAGGISCAFSAFLMHPVDTIKTQVQASTTLSFLEILSIIPEIGARGLYKGSIPAVVGQFASHGLRTSIYEASKLALPRFAPCLLDIQVN